MPGVQKISLIIYLLFFSIFSFYLTSCFYAHAHKNDIGKRSNQETLLSDEAPISFMEHSIGANILVGLSPKINNIYKNSNHTIKIKSSLKKYISIFLSIYITCFQKPLVESFHHAHLYYRYCQIII